MQFINNNKNTESLFISERKKIILLKVNFKDRNFFNHKKVFSRPKKKILNCHFVTRKQPQKS